MADQQKDTIYIDIDDEITAIIDKVQASSNKVVALVLPKRATTLQSIVNMKLLKRTADETKKNVVLITTETGLLPLAGAVGLHVAKTPSSRPEIPVAPGVRPPTDLEESVDLGDDLPQTAGNTPIGVLADSVKPAPEKPGINGIETVELDNVDDVASPVAPAAAAAAKAGKSKKDKKLHIPDFDRFRLLLIGGGALLLILIVFGYLALVVLPKATIAVKTNASNVNTNVDFTLSTAATSLSENTKQVPAKKVETQKTYTGTANATGQKNNGEKARGSVTFSSACANGIQSIPAGSAVSSGGQVYVTQRAATLSTASGGRTNCTLSGSTTVIAQQGGAKYNTSDSARFTVGSSSGGSYDAASITGNGSASGGTDDIQTVVSQADIDNAKSKITADDGALRDDLKAKLEDQGVLPILATFNAGTPAITNSSKAGDSASSVTVTQVTTYTMLGAPQEDIKALIDDDIKDQIDAGKQSILSRGITQASFKLREQTSNGATMNIQTTAEVGPALDTTEIAEQAAGKKSGDIKSDISSNPDVTEVDVKLSPFWVSSAPKNVKKITVTIAKPTTTPNND